MKRITLTWPDKTLSPNARVHHHALARAKKKARADAHRMALIYGAPKMDGCDVVVTFHPPDKRHRDLDNCIASAKAIQDGVADALGVDDSKWGARYQWGEVRKHGAVVYEITPSEPFKAKEQVDA